MTKKKKTKPFLFDFKGYRVQFPVGLFGNDVMAFTLTHDDGTSGNYLIVEMNNIPYASIPIVSKEGLGKMIRVLQEVHDNAFKKV